MMIFIDESGDVGFKIGEGSSQHFVICCICVEEKNLRLLDQNLFRIKEICHMKKIEEFKYTKSSKKIRNLFFQNVDSKLYSVYALLVTKQTVYSPTLRKNHKAFYSFFVKHSIKSSMIPLGSKIVIDGTGEREFKKQFSAYIKKDLNTDEIRVKKISFEDSKKNNLLQLADMYAGLVRESEKNMGNKIFLKNVKIWKFK